MQRFYFVTMLFILTPVAGLQAGSYVVNEGRPDLLNEPLTQKPASVSNKIVIRDPVIRKKPKVSAVSAPKIKPINALKESVHNFKSVAIDGRRSQPRVQFTLPELPMKRVDESYEIQASEKILESK